MNGLLIQTILAAGNSEGEDTLWVQILVLVMLAASWGIYSLIKTRAKKLKDQQQGYAEDTGSPGTQRRWRWQIQPSRRDIARSKAVTKIQEIRLHSPKPAEEVKSPSLAPAMETHIDEPREFISEPLKELKDKRTGILLETTQPKAIIKEPVLDFDSHEAASEQKPKGKPAKKREKDLHSGMELLGLDFLLSVVENTKGGDENDVAMRKLNFNELLRREQLNEADSSALKAYAINKGNLYGKDIQCEAMRELAERSTHKSKHSG